MTNSTTSSDFSAVRTHVIVALANAETANRKLVEMREFDKVSRLSILIHQMQQIEADLSLAQIEMSNHESNRR